MEERLRRLKDKANKLPLTPGVYIMKNSGGDIIYIGKAKALKNRVSQYFGSQEKHLPKVRKMVESVEDFDYILTDSEYEALVLECSLIKQNMPKYNILLKDDKGYSYIKVTKGEWRNIFPALQKNDDGADYIGPFTQGYSVTKAVEEAKKIYKLPTCSRVFPRDIGKERPCLNSHMGICCAPCSGKLTPLEYNKNVDGALSFLKNGSRDTVLHLKEEMETAAENLEFEKAARLRDIIKSIEKTVNRQKVVFAKYKEQDVFALSALEGKACFAVLRFFDNRLSGTEHFIIEVTDSAESMLSELISSYYSMNRSIPPRIEVEYEPEERESLEKWLSEKRGSGVNIVVPQKGEQQRLVKMCKSNATEKLCENTLGSAKERSALEELSAMLGLESVPRYIESYDISHTAGSDNVAGMVVFCDGKPLKKAYKRFMIKGFSGQDDYASMQEVLDRRFSEYEKCRENGEEEGFGRLPDLILLDGGKGQVNAVLPVMKAHKITIPVFGMVKDSKHRTSAISTAGGRVEFNSKRKAFSLVTTIQDEVHRFAVTYHRKKHTKKAVTSALTEINGVGEKRARTLLMKFGTIESLAKASESELAAVSGITKAVAHEIYTALHGE